MAHRMLIIALSTIVATSPVLAAHPEPMAPMESADAKVCLHVESVTGTRLETVQCWTRQEWAEQGVDADKEWDKEGWRPAKG